VSSDEQFATSPIYYSGPDSMSHFFDKLLEEQARICAILGRNVDMLPMSHEQQERFDRIEHCPYCQKKFSTEIKLRKVRHHCHKTGNFIGPACNTCNLQLKPRKRKSDEKDKSFNFAIPVIFHNLRGYDSHFIIKHFERRLVKTDKDKFKNVKIVASSTEKFLSFDINYLRFIDSVLFLSASLDTLVSNLRQAGTEKFVHTRRHMGTDPSLFSKGIFCYEYFDSLEKFNEKTLPAIHHFDSKLNDEKCEESDYLHAQHVFATFKCQNFKDYHDHYMQCDVLQLADVFESFRTTCLEYYQLDPAFYLTLPSFAWSAMLKLTGVELRLITDIDMELFISNSIRGGVSVISHRHAEGNNPTLEGYDPSKETSYIMYLDCNNLYGASMSEFLPFDDFTFLTTDDIDELDILNVDDDAPTGYILEVDLEYPDHLHDLHNDYPLAPESVLITEDMLSPFCLSFKQKHLEQRKLIPNLRNKTKYAIHYRNLKLYVSLGMKITKIHRVLSFSQKPWMRSYIDFNTQKRREAKNDFEKDLFKLMNNSVFGKTMENVRKRKNVQLVCDPKKLKKIISKPQLDSFKIINENTVLVNRVKSVVTLNKPCYAGFTVLDSSKRLMFEFHYNVILKRYGSSATLLFTDTDSLTYLIRTSDVYADMYADRDLYDTSNYPPSHPLFSKKNEKVIGKFKDECNGISPICFVGLRSKMYSLLVDKNKDSKKTAKGVKRGFVEKHIRHQNYLETLKTHKVTRANFVGFRSLSHTVQTVNFSRIGLSAYDDKRHVCEDGVSTLAYGHYKLRK
jgi:hypothetical protein